MPVTLTANSTPAGAIVMTANGQNLGVTPLVSQINVPQAQIGLPQTFSFTLAGYQPATAAAVPVNNAITIQATLTPVGGVPTGVPRTITVSGSGGGRIYDHHTTSARAMVAESCMVQSMRVRIRGNHSYHSDLTVSLRGPAGQSATLQRQRSRNPFRSYTVTRANGTQAQGQWTLSIRDTVGADSGHLNGFSMTLTCL
jgi:hypothetical protein